MSHDQSVLNNYHHGELLEAIETALPKIGKTTDTVTEEDLAPVDEFHIGGRVATDHLLDQLDFTSSSHVLDIGCGLGGAARHVAIRYRNKVTGIDLSPEYIATGRALCGWLNLGDSVVLQQGSATDMPFEDNIFDGGYMIHVGMNIADKAALFLEIHRVLKAGAAFGLYDVMGQDDGVLTYPVPWASDRATSKISSVTHYVECLTSAGFEVSNENIRRDFALDFFKQQRAKTQSAGGPPPLGLHTLMQGSTAERIKNMIMNIEAGFIAPVELVAKKP